MYGVEGDVLGLPVPLRTGLAERCNATDHRGCRQRADVDAAAFQRADRPGIDDDVGRAQQRAQFGIGRRRRSEEHTSELQSLMRISYAVFCLNTKKLNMI